MTKSSKYFLKAVFLIFQKWSGWLLFYTKCASIFGNLKVCNLVQKIIINIKLMTVTCNQARVPRVKHVAFKRRVTLSVTEIY